MSSQCPAEVLRLIEKAVLALQGRYHPGRPMFYAMDRLHAEIRRAQREAHIALAMARTSHATLNAPQADHAPPRKPPAGPG